MLVIHSQPTAMQAGLRTMCVALMMTCQDHANRELNEVVRCRVLTGTGRCYNNKAPRA